MAKTTVRQLERELAIYKDALEMSLAVSPSTDDNFFPGGLSGNYADRNTWDRKKVFSEALRAWRVNPIARRIVEIKTSFTIGRGVEIKCEDIETLKFLNEWWNDPLNNFQKNVKRWKDEDIRTGNLFLLFTVQSNGMTHVRAVPAEKIENIQTAENDVEQEIAFETEPMNPVYPAYDSQTEQNSFMLHFASNQPIGTPWGEPTLAPLLVWIGRFSTWLEDRVRLNKFRTAFMYVVQGQYKTEGEKKARQNYLNTNPPKSGTVLVTDPTEQWGIMSAQLDSFDAGQDGLAIKKMIAAGVGFPMHWLAEPESSTRTTAEAAGTPTFRTLEEEQQAFFSMLIKMAQVACEVKARTDNTVNPKAEIWIEGPDITEKDNAQLALAIARAEPVLADLFDRELMDEKEFIRLFYRMIAETFTGTVHKGKRKPLINNPQSQTPASEPDPGDPEDKQGDDQ
jgi:hypothetical protein